MIEGSIHFLLSFMIQLNIQSNFYCHALFRHFPRINFSILLTALPGLFHHLAELTHLNLQKSKTDINKLNPKDLLIWFRFIRPIFLEFLKLYQVFFLQVCKF